MQSEHVPDANDPEFVEYLPPLQLTHELALEAAWYVPAGQLVHSAEPETANVPAAHVTQLPPLTTRVPALHDEQLLDPRDANRPTAQAVQLVAPDAAWYLPVAQLEQVAAATIA